MIPVLANLAIVDWSGIVHGAWHEAGPEGLLKRCAGELLKLIEPPLGDEGYPVERLVLATDPNNGMELDRRKMTSHLDAPRQYKANRTKKPREFAPLVDRLSALVHALRIPTLASADFATPQTWEADDAAATACRLAREAGLSVLLVSRDKDWRQLVTDEAPAVSWWSPMDEKLLDAAGVIGEHGVPPELLADWLALVGDTSDNVPGVDKLGPKSATLLLKAWGSVAGLLAAKPLTAEEMAATTRSLERTRRERDKAKKGFAANAGELETSAAYLAQELARWKGLALVHAQREDVELSRKLVELRADVPIEWDPDEALVGGWDVREVRRVLDGLGCGWLGRGLEARPKRAPRKGARGDGETRRAHAGAGGLRGCEGRADHPEAVRGEERLRPGPSPQPLGLADRRGEEPAVVAPASRSSGPGALSARSDGLPLLPGRGTDEGVPGGDVALGRHPVLTPHLCSYSGCADAPAHVEARRLVEAIRTTGDAVTAIFKIRKLDMPEAARDEHAEQAGARFRELGGQAA